VIRHDVPAGALAVSAGAQRNIEGWVARSRPGTPAAEAAARARDEHADLSPQARAERERAGQAAGNGAPKPPPDLPDHPAPLPDAQPSTEDTAR
jgi:bifunctional UDP-N-acetylglucosamine pyrophosphorylase/glucosamine-1-phosphate N-acetyltransferase